VRNLAERRPIAYCVHDWRHQIAAVACDRLNSRQRRLGASGVALGTQALESRALLSFSLRINPQYVIGRLMRSSELIEPDDYALFGFDLALIRISSRLDLTLHVAALDRCDRTSQVIDSAKVLQRLCLQFRRETFE